MSHHKYIGQTDAGQDPQALPEGEAKCPAYIDAREAAFEAHACDLSVVPPREDGSKSPDGPWKEFQSRRMSVEELRRLYGAQGKPKRTGVGVVCGAVSGNLEVLEFDAGGRVYEPFKAAATALGLGEVVERIAGGYEERSPSGGYHWAYRCEEVDGNTKLAQYPTGEVDPATGRPLLKALIESRGEGGFVVVAPSNGRVHPTGGRYELLRGGFRSIATITPEERRALWRLARSFDEAPEAPRPTDPAGDGATAGRHGSWPDTLSPWEDYRARTTWGELLVGWTLVYERGGVQYWRRPGKDRGVSATVRPDPGGLFVFSSSTEFEPLRPYDRFQAYVRLRHAGDSKAAVKALSEAGYGQYRTWVKAAGEWKLETRQNPCPKGVRIARPGEGPPDRNRGSRGDGDGGATASPRRDFPTTDLGNAERLVARHGKDLRYCHPWVKWLAWDGRRWAPDNLGRVGYRAKLTVRGIYREAAEARTEDERKALASWARESEKRDRIAAMIKLAQSERRIPILPVHVDRDPWLFNCRNGTVDLRTGLFRDHQREDLITQLCPVDYDPAATCPLWEDTLRLFFAGRTELIDYWRRICGYALAGVIRDHVLPIAYGVGSNGKTTILGTLVDVFGPDYAMRAPPDMLMARRYDNHPTDRADLHGKRLVVAIETEEGRRLNETMVKELTGGDRIRARRMREDFWEFTPTHTLIMATNHKPVVRGTDRGIWRRLRLVPFTVVVEDDQADKTMPERLKAEYPGILAWCVRGCLEWQERGLDDPQSVTEATAGYRSGQDTLGAFLGECTVAGREMRVKAGELYARYKAWIEAAGEPAMSLKAFGLAIEERGFEKKPSNGIWYLGMGLRQFCESEY